MKHLFYIATFLLPLLTVAQIESKIIDADIRGRGCAGGLGLCTVQIPLDKDKGKTSTAPKTTITIQSPNAFILEINIRQLTEKEQISIVGKPLTQVSQKESISFVQEADLIIDEKTLTYLGLNSKHNLLKAGNYPMEMTSEKILITFTLTHN